jgi:hypothetical protein
MMHNQEATKKYIETQLEIKTEKRINKQISMFTEGQDLPLISQTPQCVKEQVFKPTPRPAKNSLFNAQCGLCLDTGKVGKDRKICICQK